MTDRKALLFVEIDIDYCSRTYGAGACTATMDGPNPTGPRKCFNSPATCQVREVFANSPATLRFARGTAYLAESGIDAIPCIEAESFTPQTVSLGENLGTRASLSVTFSDFKWPDTGPGFDKYAGERDYDPFGQGTFWGKFRARQPFLRGRPIRIIRGYLGQTLEEMETRHFVMESFEGPSLDGRYTIIAKDALKLADDERAQAPRPSNGYLNADISAGQTSVTIAPAGIGNLDYPASGWVNIGGNEICAFTRSGNTFTLTRGQFNTAAVAHKAQDRLQLCLRYEAEDAAAILRDLFVNYAAMPDAYVPLEEWSEETSSFLGVLFSAMITEPTGVNRLASELVQQAALSVWWDDVARLMRLRVLRPILTDAARFDDTGIARGSLRIKDQPEKRLSQVWVYYGQINPTLRADEPSNYRSLYVTSDPQAEADYGQPAVKRIFGRFIPEFGRLVAERAGGIQLGQYTHAPRLLSFDVFRDGPILPELGMGCRIAGSPLQTDTGARDAVPAQITRLMPREDGYLVEASELRFKQFTGDLGDRTIIIGSNIANFNWRAAYDQLYPPPQPDDDIVCVINAGVIVRSTSVNQSAFVVGSWPGGTNLRLEIRGRIAGAGGAGGNGRTNSNSGQDGQDGGTALYTRAPLYVLLHGRLWGGGGGGGGGTSDLTQGAGGGGGGGAGIVPGQGGSGRVPQSTGARSENGRAGSATSGGNGGRGRWWDGTWNSDWAGGAGGGWGQGGSNGRRRWPAARGGSGGAAGPAINGNSFVTLTGSGDLRGRRIN